MEQLMEQRVSLDLTTSDYSQAFEDQNPFRNEKIPRNIMPPACKKGMTLQFRWEHFEYLCKTVLQRLKKPYKPEYLMTFKKNSPKYAAGLRDNIRSIHGLDSSATWSDLTDKIRREAEVLFEKLVDDEFPLRACVENWGAKLIMRKAFLKHDKAEEQTVDKNAVGDCTVEATENVDGMSDAESINTTSEHDDNLLEEYDMLFIDEEPIRFDEEPAGFGNETLMLDTKLSSDEDEDCMEEQKTNIKEKHLQNQIDPNVYGNNHKQPSTIQAQRSLSAVQKKTIYKQTKQVQDLKPDTRKEMMCNWLLQLSPEKED
ncbi:hypothetical protein INT45_009565 [Circinella minor]|uniref:Uncharacterized protein n=1 Tax=Circinella minor TaxID=1195481 RepID=A0A8H7RN66_9FUNG|nr:hypothetical protein INT45_009565 [Circinella minor]